MQVQEILLVDMHAAISPLTQQWCETGFVNSIERHVNYSNCCACLKASLDLCVRLQSSTAWTNEVHCKQPCRHCRHTADLKRGMSQDMHLHRPGWLKEEGVGR
jgi:hypothetical protein